MKDHKTQTVSRAEYEDMVAKYKDMATKYKDIAAKYAKAQHTIDNVKETIKIMTETAGTRDIPTNIWEGDVRVGNAHIDSIEKRLDKAVAAQNGRNVRGDGHHMVWMRMDLMDEYIQDDGLLHDLTLLKPMMFEYIVYKVEQYMERDGGKLYYDLKVRSTDSGNRSKLKMRYIVFMAFFTKRMNALPVATGALFGMHRTTADRQIDFMDKVLETVLPGVTAMGKRLRAIESSEEFIKFTKGILMHDGTLTRAHDSKDTDNEETSGFSGKHHASGFNTVLTCTGTGLLVAQSKTVPGNQHDFRVMKENPIDLGLFHMNGEPENEESAKVMEKVENIVDKGFAGMDKHFTHIKSVIPHKGKDVKSPKEIREAYKSKDKGAIASALGLTPEQYDENRANSSRRSLIERSIGSLKRWAILVGVFRGTASDLNRQFEILSGITNLEILWSEIEQNEAPLLAMLAKKRAAYTKKR